MKLICFVLFRAVSNAFSPLDGEREFNSARDKKYRLLEQYLQWGGENSALSSAYTSQLFW